MNYEYGVRTRSAIDLAEGALSRRDQWENREQARAAFEKSKHFFGRWDKEILDRFMDFGLVKDNGSGNGTGEGTRVRLKVDKVQEAYVFEDPDNLGARRTFYRLSYLPKTINVHLICGDVGMSIFSEKAYDHFSEVVHHATTARIKGAAHLVVQEKPKEVAYAIAEYLGNTEKYHSVSKAKL